MADEIIIEGLDDLSRVLTEQTASAAKRYLGRCGDKAAQVVIAAMHETVPVDVGYLEESLVYQKRFTNGDDNTTLEILIGPTKSAYWGSFREFGTRFQAGIHWMGRAWESCKDKCLSVFATEALSILADLENKK